MYKGASQSLQRRHRVIEVRADPSAYVADDDLIQSAANLGKRECEAERRDLLTERTRLENELMIAKRTRSKSDVDRIGHRISGICARLSMLRARLHEIERGSELESFKAAVKEVVPADMLQQIFERQKQIKSDLEAML